MHDVVSLPRQCEVTATSWFEAKAAGCNAVQRLRSLLQVAHYYKLLRCGLTLTVRDLDTAYLVLTS